MKTFYHVTKKESLESILKNGLIPQVGERSIQLDEEPGVFLFPSLDSLDNAMMNWLGEEFGDEVELVALKVEIDDTNLDYIAFEAISREIIDAKSISYLRDE